VEEIWPSDDTDDDTVVSEPTRNTSSQPIWQLLFFLLLWQSVFRVSNAAITSLLCFMKYFIGAVGNAFQCFQVVALSQQVPQTMSCTLCWYCNK